MRTRVLPWFVAVLGLVGACEGRPVRRICTLAESCGCMNTQDVNACQNGIQQDATNTQEQAAMQGLAFDADCYLARLDEFVDVLGCRSQTEVAGEFERLQLCGACDVVHGAQPEGAACQTVPVSGFVAANASDCAERLRCVGGFCLDLCSPRAAGEPCVIDLADGTTATYACAGGSCDVASRTCVAALADGQPCTDGGQCSSGWCRTGVCDGPPQLGDACSFDGECGDALACKDGACAALPTAGQPCPDFRCAPGSTCQQVPTQGGPDQQLCVSDGPWQCPGG